MIARVLETRDDARVALGVMAATAAILALAALDDRAYAHLFPISPGAVGYAVIALVIALSGLAPWLVRTSRGRLSRVTCEMGTVRAGSLVIRASEVVGVRVARGRRGRSLAIARDGARHPVFFEVDREEDVVPILRALGFGQVPSGEIGLKPAKRRLALAQAALSLGALVSALLYAGGTMEWIRGASKSDGMYGVILAQLAICLLAWRRFASDQAIAPSRGLWDDHVELHREEEARRAAEAEPDMVVAEAWRGVPKISALARRDESVGEWIARIDGIPTVESAYRAGAVDHELLWEVLKDPNASVDERTAAARLLRRRYGDQAQAIERAVEDPDVRVRVSVAASVEADDEASRELEALGPLFRAR